MHYITNKYNGKKVFVKCGGCKSCRQEKANKLTNKIRNHHDSSKFDTLFVTLTYGRGECPYIDKSELQTIFNSLKISKDFHIPSKQDSFINVYRDINKRIVFNPYTHETKTKVSYEKTLISSTFVENDDFLSLGGFTDPRCFDKLRSLSHEHGKVGVIYYPDFQNFFKRLRINLYRHDNFSQKFDFFLCTEYGPTTIRPHAHIILFVPKGTKEIFVRNIIQSWPYGDRNRLKRYIESEVDASGYVSSYVNCSSFVPPFLLAAFPPKHSASSFLGTNNNIHSLGSILRMQESRNYSYLQQINVKGDYSLRLLPSHVINRYFPKFKGFGKLTNSEIYNLICNTSDPTRYHRFVSRCYYSENDIMKIQHQIDNGYWKTFMSMSNGITREDYAKLFISVWTTYSCFCLRQQYEQQVPLFEMYDNIDDFIRNPSISPNLASVLSPNDIKETDPNNFLFRQQSSNKFAAYYDLRTKQKKVTSRCINDMEGSEII